MGIGCVLAAARADAGGCPNLCTIGSHAAVINPRMELNCLGAALDVDRCDCGVFLSVFNSCAGPVDAQGFVFDQCTGAADENLGACASIPPSGDARSTFRVAQSDGPGLKQWRLPVQNDGKPYELFAEAAIIQFHPDDCGCATTGSAPTLAGLAMFVAIGGLAASGRRRARPRR